jgi:hypothetical protein
VGSGMGVAVADERLLRTPLSLGRLLSRSLLWSLPFRQQKVSQ